MGRKAARLLRFQKIRRFLFPLLALLIVGLLFILDEEDKHLVFWSGLGIYLLALALNLALWRCPACGGFLGRGFSVRFCRHCGKATPMHEEASRGGSDQPGTR